MSSTSLDTKPSLGGIIKNGAIAAVLGIVVNAILYFISAALGWMPPDVLNQMGEPITLVPVVLVTTMGALAGIIGYIVLTRFLSRAQANRWFTIVAIVVLVLMIYTPFTLPGAPVGQIVVLEIMHLVIGGALIYFLPKSA